MVASTAEVSLIVRHTFWELQCDGAEVDSCVSTRRRAQSMSAIEGTAFDDDLYVAEKEKDHMSSGSTTPSGSFPGTFDFSVSDSANDTMPGTPHESDDELVGRGSWANSSPVAGNAWWTNQQFSPASSPSASNGMVPVMVPMQFMMPVTPDSSLEGTAKALTAAAERLQKEARTARVAAASARIESLDIAVEQRTTLMLRDLPKSMSRKMLTDVLDARGLKNRYNFVYMPLDFKKGKSLGYAFVNFAAHTDADFAMNCFQGFTSWPVSTDAACVVVWSAPHQGLEAHIERYRDSPVMHPDVPEEFKPLLLRNGVSVPFPAPTKDLSPPSITPKSSKQHTGRGRRSRA